MRRFVMCYSSMEDFGWRAKKEADRKPEARQERVEQSPLLPAGTISAAQRDQEMVRRELPNRVLEGEQRLVGAESTTGLGTELLQRGRDSNSRTTERPSTVFESTSVPL